MNNIILLALPIDSIYNYVHSPNAVCGHPYSFMYKFCPECGAVNEQSKTNTELKPGFTKDGDVIKYHHYFVHHRCKRYWITLSTIRLPSGEQGNRYKRIETDFGTISKFRDDLAELQHRDFHKWNLEDVGVYYLMDDRC